MTSEQGTALEYAKTLEEKHWCQYLRASGSLYKLPRLGRVSEKPLAAKTSTTMSIVRLLIECASALKEPAATVLFYPHWEYGNLELQLFEEDSDSTRTVTVFELVTFMLEERSEKLALRHTRHSQINTQTRRE